MPGLFDFLGQSDPQQQGLLSAAAAILNASGPSLTPRSFGQVMGAGLTGYQQGQGQAHDQALSALKLKALRDEQADKEKARQDALAAQEWLLNYNKAKSAPMPAPQPADSMFRGSMNGNLPPVAEEPGAAQSAPASDPFSQRMAMAQQMRASGIPALMKQADALEEHAMKFKPEFSQTPQVGTVNGKPVMYVLDKDGNPKVLNGMLPRDKLELANLGGREMAYNPYDLRPGQTFQRTNSPDAIIADRRAREFNAIQQDANNIKRGEKQAETNMTKNSQVASFDTMLGTLDRLASHPGLSRSVGITGALPTMPGSDSANFQAELNTFQSQAFLPMVAQLKGMGALSDAEGKKLTAAVGALDPRMGEPAFRSSIERIKADMNAARQRVAGSMTSVGQAPSQPSQRVATLADIAATARATGKTTKQVTADLRAAGYTIGGQ